jgi:hypothetical protein
MTARDLRRATRSGAAILGAAFALALTAAPAHAAVEDEPDVSVLVPTASPSASPSPSPEPTRDPDPSPSPQPTRDPDPRPTTNPPATGGGAPGAGASGGGGGAATSGGSVPRASSAGGDADKAPAAEPKECVEPEAPSGPATSGEEATVDGTIHLPGERVVARAAGFGAGEQVQFALFTDPQVLGTFTADEKGAVRAELPLAKDAQPGTYAVQFTGWCETVAIAQVLVGSESSAAADAPFGVPPWAMWTGGGIGAAGLAFGARRVFLAMRVPAEGVAA